MPKISFVKAGRSDLEVSRNSNLMKTLLEAGIPVASSCHGDGVCAKCRLKIISGSDFLSEPNETEIFLKQKFSLPSDIRISCQTEILGDVVVDASYW